MLSVHLATPLLSPPLHPVQSFTSPIPILTSPASSSPAPAPSIPLATTHIHSWSFPPVDSSITSLDCGDSQLSPAYFPGLLGQPHRRDSVSSHNEAKPQYPSLGTEESSPVRWGNVTKPPLKNLSCLGALNYYLTSL